VPRTRSDRTRRWPDEVEPELACRSANGLQGSTRCIRADDGRCREIDASTRGVRHPWVAEDRDTRRIARSGREVRQAEPPETRIQSGAPGSDLDRIGRTLRCPGDHDQRRAGRRPSTVVVRMQAGRGTLGAQVQVDACVQGTLVRLGVELPVPVAWSGEDPEQVVLQHGQGSGPHAVARAVAQPRVPSAESGGSRILRMEDIEALTRDERGRARVVGGRR
jgi:hypothetical protein